MKGVIEEMKIGGTKLFSLRKFVTLTAAFQSRAADHQSGKSRASDGTDVFILATRMDVGTQHSGRHLYNVNV